MAEGPALPLMPLAMIEEGTSDLEKTEVGAVAAKESQPHTDILEGGAIASKPLESNDGADISKDLADSENVNLKVELASEETTNEGDRDRMDIDEMTEEDTKEDAVAACGSSSGEKPSSAEEPSELNDNENAKPAKESAPNEPEPMINGDSGPQTSDQELTSPKAEGMNTDNAESSDPKNANAEESDDDCQIISESPSPSSSKSFKLKQKRVEDFMQLPTEKFKQSPSYKHDLPCWVDKFEKLFEYIKTEDPSNSKKRKTSQKPVYLFRCKHCVGQMGTKRLCISGVGGFMVHLNKLHATHYSKMIKENPGYALKTKLKKKR